MAVSLTNFLDSGCIVASSVALTAWAAAFGFGSTWTAILGAIGANAFGAAVGALIGGFLTDKFGRTAIYKYNLLVYALGVFIAMVAVNLPMVVVGVVLSGLSVGAGVPASWSYISETSSSTKRASNIGISQFAWCCGPAIIFIVSLALSFILPGFESDGTTLLPAGTYGPFDGLLATRILFAILFIVALIAWNLQRQLQESADWAEKNEEGAEKVGFGKMMSNALKNPVNVKTIIFLVAVYLTWNLAAGTNGQFMPYLYAAAGNIDSTGQSLLGVVQWVLVAVCSLAIFSKSVTLFPTACCSALPRCWHCFPGSPSPCSASPSRTAIPTPWAGSFGSTLSCGAFPLVSLLSASTHCGAPSCSPPSTAAAFGASCSSWFVAHWASGRS